MARLECGCEVITTKPDDVEPPWCELGFYDEEKPVWIRTCDLHQRYGHHCEMSGYDEGLCK